MRGVDTNILLRIFLNDDDRRHTLARHVLTIAARAGGCLLHPIVLAEFVWTARFTFQIERKALQGWIDRIMEAPEFVFVGRPAVSMAVDTARPKPDRLADFLIGTHNRASGASTTHTFDRSALPAPELFTHASLDLI